MAVNYKHFNMVLALPAGTLELNLATVHFPWPSGTSSCRPCSRGQGKGDIYEN
jgi:hypothetical protein